MVTESKTFNAAGLTKSITLGIDAQTYPVVTNNRYTRDALVQETTYGDTRNLRSATVSQMQYDARRRPKLFQTLRQGSVPAPGTRPLSAVTTVVDQLLHWDGVGNLVAVDDRRLPLQWPAGHRPQSAQIAHDALYRVEVVSFDYTQDNASQTPVDQGTDWRTTASAHRNADPMRAGAAPMASKVPTARVSNLEYQHDWLANMVDWTEQSNPAFYERSIGTITNGNGLGAGYRPSALYLASDLTGPATDKGGWIEVDYGTGTPTASSGGNVTAMTVHAQCINESASLICADPGGPNLTTRRDTLFANCDCTVEQHYAYRYDELNRLSEARRFDREAGSWTLKVRQRYRYDFAEQRVIKETTDPALPAPRVALYLDGFERRGLQSTATAYQVIAGDSEALYIAGGARVVWQNRNALVAGLDPDHRITVPLTDVVGSTSAVFDLMSGQLLESTGFYPNGGREHWQDSSEAGATTMPLEFVGFTGKEAEEEVGLTYFGARYLIPRIGRWSTPDPLSIHDAGGGEVGNSYHYVSGQLLQARDPLGLDVKTNRPIPEAQQATFGGDTHYAVTTADHEAPVNGTQQTDFPNEPGETLKFYTCKGKCSWDPPGGSVRKDPAAIAQQEGGTISAIAGGVVGAVCWMVTMGATNDRDKAAAVAQVGAAVDGVLQAAGINKEVIMKAFSGKPEKPSRPTQAAPSNQEPTGRDPWSREPKSIQDKMVLDAAKKGAGIKIMDNLGDPNFKGWEKWEYREKSQNGRNSVVHYVRDPKTSELLDFKFKQHSTDKRGNYESKRDPSVPPGDKPEGWKW